MRKIRYKDEVVRSSIQQKPEIFDECLYIMDATDEELEAIKTVVKTAIANLNKLREQNDFTVTYPDLNNM